MWADMIDSMHITDNDLVDLIYIKKSDGGDKAMNLFMFLYTLESPLYKELIRADHYHDETIQHRSRPSQIDQVRLRETKSMQDRSSPSKIGQDHP